MGIFSRFTDIINANINSILDKAEDPEKMVRLIIQEMEETLVEVRTQSAKLIADKKELGRRTERMKKEAAEWERKAETAISKDREDLARAALKEKTAALEEVDTVSSDLGQIEHNLEKLSDDIGLLQQKLGDAKARQKALILRGKTAKSRIGVKRQLHEVDIDAAIVFAYQSMRDIGYRSVLQSDRVTRCSDRVVADKRHPARGNWISVREVKYHCFTI
ncbi:MAG: PspA/IM30 family protein, partial [bacterium]